MVLFVVVVRVGVVVAIASSSEGLPADARTVGRPSDNVSVGSIPAVVLSNRRSLEYCPASRRGKTCDSIFSTTRRVQDSNSAYVNDYQPEFGCTFGSLRFFESLHYVLVHST